MGNSSGNISQRQEQQRNNLNEIDGVNRNSPRQANEPEVRPSSPSIIAISSPANRIPQRSDRYRERNGGTILSSTLKRQWMNMQQDEYNKQVLKYIDRFSDQFQIYQKEHKERQVQIQFNQQFLEINCKTWSKNSFGLFNYNNQSLESDMIKTQVIVAGKDTKIMRHEKTIEIDNDNNLIQVINRNKNKIKKNIVTLTAKDSDIQQDKDTETMDINNKDQETSQLLRVMYQKVKKKDNLQEGYWIYHKNKVSLASIYTNPEEKLWYVVSKYPKEAFKSQGYKLEKNSIIRMGRIRLRVRDIDYPEPKVKKEKAHNEQKSIKSISPRSIKSKGANKTNLSTNRKPSDSIIDVGDIDLSQLQVKAMRLNGEGVIGEDGGLELVQKGDLFNKIDVLTNNKINKSLSAKKKHYVKSDNLGADDFISDNKTIIQKKKNEESVKSSHLSIKSEMVCRICLDYDNKILEKEDENYNPMISPCNCSGTMGGIHLKCLREWLERNKTMKAVKGHVVLKYKKINCELCKQKFPFSVNVNNKIVDIIQVERPKDNFIILETLSSGVQKEEYTKSKVFFILNTENKQTLQIGRNTTCDVRIGDDISVSRTHSLIKKIGQHYYIEDNDSTFGTLVQVQYPIFLTSQLFYKYPLVLQSGKTQISMHCRILKQASLQDYCNSLNCFQYCTKLPKKSNKGLVTFDKKNYFPFVFVEQQLQDLYNNQIQNKQDKKQLKKIITVGSNIVQGIEEDVAANGNNEAEGDANPTNQNQDAAISHVNRNDISIQQNDPVQRNSETYQFQRQISQGFTQDDRRNFEEQKNENSNLKEIHLFEDVRNKSESRNLRQTMPPGIQRSNCSAVVEQNAEQNQLQLEDNQIVQRVSFNQHHRNSSLIGFNISVSEASGRNNNFVDQRIQELNSVNECKQLQNISIKQQTENRISKLQSQRGDGVSQYGLSIDFQLEAANNPLIKNPTQFIQNFQEQKKISQRSQVKMQNPSVFLQNIQEERKISQRSHIRSRKHSNNRFENDQEFDHEFQEIDIDENVRQTNSNVKLMIQHVNNDYRQKSPGNLQSQINNLSENAEHNYIKQYLHAQNIENLNKNDLSAQKIGSESNNTIITGQYPSAILKKLEKFRDMKNNQQNANKI